MSVGGSSWSLSSESSNPNPSRHTTQFHLGQEGSSLWQSNAPPASQETHGHQKTTGLCSVVGGSMTVIVHR